MGFNLSYQNVDAFAVDHGIKSHLEFEYKYENYFHVIDLVVCGNVIMSVVTTASVLIIKNTDKIAWMNVRCVKSTKSELIKIIY